MTEKTKTRAQLSEGEETVLQAIRRWRYSAVDLADVKIVGAERVRLAGAVRPFMDLLREADPYVVRVNRTTDPSMTLFELQLLYILSECRAGNSATTTELLDWWFPDRLVANARVLLEDFAFTIDTLALAFNSSAWIRDHLLSVTNKRIKQTNGSLRGSAATRFGFWAERTVTFH